MPKIYKHTDLLINLNTFLEKLKNASLKNSTEN